MMGRSVFPSQDGEEKTEALTGSPAGMVSTPTAADAVTASRVVRVEAVHPLADAGQMRPRRRAALTAADVAPTRDARVPAGLASALPDTDVVSPRSDPSRGGSSARRCGRSSPCRCRPTPADASRHLPTPADARAAAPADAAYRAVRHPPIPHYADSLDPETRTTAIPDVP